MSYQREEDFDSIYASIDDDDDFDEMYVDVSSTSPFNTSSGGGPAAHVDPNFSPPLGRKLPPIPPKSAAGGSSKPPWPRPAPQPPSNLSSYKANTVTRNIPLPLPRSAKEKKEKGTKKPPVKSRQLAPQQSATSIGYSPPLVSGEGQTSSQGGRGIRDMAAATRYQDTVIKPFDARKDRNPPPAARGRNLPNPPPPDTPPPDSRTGTAVSGYGTGGSHFQEAGNVLNASPADDNAEYESLRPARQRLRRGYGQQSRRSRRYSGDTIPLQNMPSDDDEDRRDNRGRRRNGGGREEVEETSRHRSDNSTVVCILLTITVIALLIALMSLATSVYTLTRFEILRRSNDTDLQCDVVVNNCTADVSRLLCSQVSCVYIDKPIQCTANKSTTIQFSRTLNFGRDLLVQSLCSSYELLDYAQSYIR